jgi:U4/U6.U5 tri-snRNP-associated protein 2
MTAGDDQFDEEDEIRPLKRHKRQELVKGLYLETVDRTMLDFDFEKLCSVSMNNINVYACLTCGKYFQGKFYQALF